MQEHTSTLFCIALPRMTLCNKTTASSTSSDPGSGAEMIGVGGRGMGFSTRSRNRRGLGDSLPARNRKNNSYMTSIRKTQVQSLARTQIFFFIHVGTVYVHVHTCAGVRMNINFVETLRATFYVSKRYRIIVGNGDWGGA